MKFAVVLFVLCVVIFDKCNGDGMKKTMDACAEEKHVSEAEMKLLTSYEVPTTPEGKCVLSCLMKKKNWMIPDNTFDMAAIKSGLNKIKIFNNDLYHHLLKIIEECKPAGPSSNECGVSATVTSCVQPKLKQVMQ